GAGLFRGTLATLAAVAALAAIARWSYTQSQERFTKKYGSVQLQFELLLRAGEETTAELPVAEVREDEAPRQATWDTGTQEQFEGRRVLSGGVRLYRLTSKRQLVVLVPHVR